MSGTGARGQTHPQPLIAPIVTLGPTTLTSDKSLVFLVACVRACTATICFSLA